MFKRYKVVFIGCYAFVKMEEAKIILVKKKVHIALCH